MPYHLVHSGWMISGCRVDHRPHNPLVEGSNGLKFPRKLPFKWTAEKMGNCMVDLSLSSKSSCESIFFYKILTRLLRALPAKYTMTFLGKL